MKSQQNIIELVTRLGPAKVMRSKKPPLVRIVEGKVVSYVEVFTPWMRHQVRMNNLQLLQCKFVIQTFKKSIKKI